MRVYTRPSSSTRPGALSTPSSHSHSTPSSPPAPLPARRAPNDRAGSPRLLTPPPAHVHLPPCPVSARHPRGRAPLPGHTRSVSPHPVSTLCGSDRCTGNRPRVRFLVRPGDARRGGRGGGGGPGRPAGSRPQPAAAVVARGSPGPGAAPGVLPQSPSPAEQRRGHQHFSNHLKAISVAEARESFPSEPTVPALWSFQPPGRASRLSAPPPPNDQLPATLLPGAARGWLAAARKRQPGSLLHDN